MQSEGIISTTITRDIREKGHQTIRFSPGGFSLLVSDASFRPVHLSVHESPVRIPESGLADEFLRVRDELGLADFTGETTIIQDKGPAALIPSVFYEEEAAPSLLASTRPLEDNDHIDSRYIRSRELYLIQAIPRETIDLKDVIQGKIQIMHPLECMLSLSDQVQASDHQRGFLLAEVQETAMSLLVARKDKLILLNRFDLNDTSDFIYHVLNCMRQLELDREAIPLYLSGIIHEDHELNGLVHKYVRIVKPTPYYLETLSRKDISRFMLLSEASKCA